MHGRLKVRSSEEQEEARKKERQAKARKYREITERIYEKRASGEKDDEALKLTRDVLSVNPEITTLWNYRREVLQDRQKTISSDEFSQLCDVELSLLETCLRVNPKAYCVWLHREWILQTTPNPDWIKEKRLCDVFLKYDERNFHCWDYRRFVISKSKCVTTSQELQFTYDKIAANFSNYSAWHYRSKLLPQVHPSKVTESGISEKALLKEYELAQNAFFTDPDDQSAWFYHRWLLGKVDSAIKIDLVYVQCAPSLVLYVVFTQPVMLDVPLLVVVDEVCTSVQGSDWPSILYQCALPRHHCTTVNVSYGQQQVTLSVANGDQWWVNDGVLAHSNTGATLSMLTSELDSCEQLLEEEPQNKWCLLTTMLLMQSLDPNKYSSQIKTKAHQLMTVDPYRKSYYRDLLSQFVIQEVLKESLSNLQQANRTVDLSGKGLSRLEHTEYLVACHTVVLSNNQLTSLPAPLVLPALHTLILDDNNLETLPPGSSVHMKSLKVLSIKNNNISMLSSIDSYLKGLLCLSVLHLQGNPLCQDKGLTEKVKQLLPTLTQLNTTD